MEYLINNSSMESIILASDEGFYGLAEMIKRLQGGVSALDAIEAGIRLVEDDEQARTVGYGGAPNILGEMELDASLMDGRTLLAGTVGALRGYRHPISVARAVMEKLPHVMLVGEGAARFAKEIEAEPRDMLSPVSKKEYRDWLKINASKELLADPAQAKLAPLISSQARPNISHVPVGTVTVLVRDSQGTWGGGVSTSGWAYKYPGRLGDSPIIGAGLYVDNRYGAAACTHGGEMTMRCGTARTVVAYMKKGASVEQACREAVEDLRYLKGAYIGAVIIHALDREGTPCCVALGDNDGDCYYYWKSGMTDAQKAYPQR
jgi:L-asparaginase